MSSPLSNAFNSYYSELSNCNNIDQLKPSDISRLMKKMPVIPKLSFSPFERSRIIRDMKTHGLDVKRRLADIKNTAQNGFEDIKIALNENGFNCLFNPSKLQDVLNNQNLTFGEKRTLIVNELASNFKNISDDPSIKASLAKILPDEREKLVLIKDAFLVAKTPEEKAKVLEELNHGSFSQVLKNFKNLCLISIDDPKFMHAALFEIPYDTQPPIPIREALLSLFFQGDPEKYHSSASYTAIKEDIIGFHDYKSIPKKLENWNEKINENSNPSLRTLTPALKNLSKRLTKHTHVSIGDYFRAIFSPKIKAQNNQKNAIAKTIPQIEKLREKLKSKTTDRAHFKNIKRNCVEIEKNPHLPTIRLKCRKEIAKDIPLRVIDMALDKLNEGSYEGVQNIIKDYDIKNDEALVKLLAIRLVHYPTLAAVLSSNNYDSNPELKQFIKKLNSARSEVLRTLMSYE